MHFSLCHAARRQLLLQRWFRYGRPAVALCRSAVQFLLLQLSSIVKGFRLPVIVLLVPFCYTTVVAVAAAMLLRQPSAV
jgi:hypothetical protein